MEYPRGGLGEIYGVYLSSVAYEHFGEILIGYFSDWMVNYLHSYLLVSGSRGSINTSAIDMPVVTGKSPEYSLENENDVKFTSQIEEDHGHDNKAVERDMV